MLTEIRVNRCSKYLVTALIVRFFFTNSATKREKVMVIFPQ